METITIEIQRATLDKLLEKFMSAATEWAKAEDAYTRGLYWGEAFGIYCSLGDMGLIGGELKDELMSVLLSKK